MQNSIDSLDQELGELDARMTATRSELSKVGMIRDELA
jgi:hypothetical protein